MIEVLKQALEALLDWRKGYPHWSDFDTETVNKLRQAISDLEKQKPVTSFDDYCKTLPPFWNTRIRRTTAEEFFHAGWLSAQPIKQEPVAYMVKAHGVVQALSVRADVADEKACEWRRNSDPKADLFPLYTSPQPRKPLTEEEIYSICKDLGMAQLSTIDFARAIESAHGIGEKI
jgi:hypothetical protein